MFTTKGLRLPKNALKGSKPHQIGCFDILKRENSWAKLEFYH